MVLTPSQITVGVCNQITLLILYCIISRQATLLEVIAASKQVSDTFCLNISFRFINFGVKIFVSFTKYLLASGLTLFR